MRTTADPESSSTKKSCDRTSMTGGPAAYHGWYGSTRVTYQTQLSPVSGAVKAYPLARTHPTIFTISPARALAIGVRPYFCSCRSAIRRF